MYFARFLVASLFCAVSAAQAQSATAPLDLALPTAATPSQGSPAVEPQADAAPPAATPSTAVDPASVSEPFDTTYGDRRDGVQEGCDDKTYGQPELHGSVGMGVAAAKHASANYETAELNASKALGSCDDPKGYVSASIRVTKSNVNFKRGNGP
jgi:hypothetical protein